MTKHNATAEPIEALALSKCRASCQSHSGLLAMITHIWGWRTLGICIHAPLTIACMCIAARCGAAIRAACLAIMSVFRVTNADAKAGRWC